MSRCIDLSIPGDVEIVADNILWLRMDACRWPDTQAGVCSWAEIRSADPERALELETCLAGPRLTDLGVVEMLVYFGY